MKWISAGARRLSVRYMNCCLWYPLSIRSVLWFILLSKYSFQKHFQVSFVPSAFTKWNKSSKFANIGTNGGVCLWYARPPSIVCMGSNTSFSRSDTKKCSAKDVLHWLCTKSKRKVIKWPSGDGGRGKRGGKRKNFKRLKPPESECYCPLVCVRAEMPTVCPWRTRADHSASYSKLTDSQMSGGPDRPWHFDTMCPENGRGWNMLFWINNAIQFSRVVIKD